MTRPHVVTPLTDILAPAAHERIIQRLAGQMDAATPLENARLAEKIGWHTREYQKKTGELPRK